MRLTKKDKHISDPSYHDVPQIQFSLETIEEKSNRVETGYINEQPFAMKRVTPYLKMGLRQLVQNINKSKGKAQRNVKQQEIFNACLLIGMEYFENHVPHLMELRGLDEKVHKTDNESIETWMQTAMVGLNECIGSGIYTVRLASKIQEHYSLLADRLHIPFPYMLEIGVCFVLMQAPRSLISKQVYIDKFFRISRQFIAWVSKRRAMAKYLLSAENSESNLTQREYCWNDLFSEEKGRVTESTQNCVTDVLQDEEEYY